MRKNSIGFISDAGTSDESNLNQEEALQCLLFWYFGIEKTIAKILYNKDKSSIDTPPNEWYSIGAGTAPGRCCTYKSYIIAEDNVEAEYLWHMHLKEDENDRYTWDLGKRNCCTHAEIRGGSAIEADKFSRLYPRRSKKGVYKCEPEYHHNGSDHLWD